MTQSRKMLLNEAVTNVALGYGLAVVTQIIVFPWFGLEALLGEHLAIGLVFLAISLARGYVLLRLLEGLRVANRPGGHGGHREPAQTRR